MVDQLSDGALEPARHEREVVRRPVLDRDDLRDFVAAHARPGLAADARFLLGLARGPDSVFDLHDDNGRTVVAVLTDACENSGDAAELVVLACRDMWMDRSTLSVCVQRAIAVAAGGPHEHLEIVVGDVVRPHRDLLMSMGFAPRFEMVSMERRGPHEPAVAPPTLFWRDLRAEDEDDLRRLSRAAFRGHPGVNFPPDDHADRSFLHRSPPIRLLLDGPRLVGSVSVRREQRGLGVIETIQRDPSHVGRGLGPVLLTKALRLLADAGCERIRLDAAVENRRALSLYERFGFEMTEVMPVLGLRTRSEAPCAGS